MLSQGRRAELNDKIDGRPLVLLFLPTTLTQLFQGHLLFQAQATSLCSFLIRIHIVSFTFGSVDLDPSMLDRRLLRELTIVFLSLGRFVDRI